MPYIQVTLAEGRTDEQKRALMAALTQAACDSIGAPLSSVRVWIHEVKRTELMAEGQLLSER